MSFSFKFFNSTTDENLVAPIDGCLINGLFVEGCRFDLQKQCLLDSNPGIIYTDAPIIHFIPTENYKPDPKDYSMPVYKTVVRAGTLSTTGHSTNFIISIDCPTKMPPNYWILNGAAFTCSLIN